MSHFNQSLILPSAALLGSSSQFFTSRVSPLDLPAVFQKNFKKTEKSLLSEFRLFQKSWDFFQQCSCVLSQNMPIFQGCFFEKMPTIKKNQNKKKIILKKQLHLNSLWANCLQVHMDNSPSSVCFVRMTAHYWVLHSCSL